VNKDTFPEIVLPIKVETTTVVVVDSTTTTTTVDSTTTTTVVEEVDAHVVSSLQEKPFFLFMIFAKQIYSNYFSRLLFVEYF